MPYLGVQSPGRSWPLRATRPLHPFIASKRANGPRKIDEIGRHSPAMAYDPTTVGRCYGFSEPTPRADGLLAEPVWSRNSSGLAVVEFEEATQAFATLNWSGSSAVCTLLRKEDLVVFPLVRALGVVMFQELRKGSAKPRLEAGLS